MEEKEEEKVEVGVTESIPLPKSVEQALNSNNQFLTNFLSTYNYKQRSELRVSSIRTIVFITGFKGAAVATACFKFIIELEATSEMMVLKEEHWNCNKEDLDKAGFTSSVVSRIQARYYNMMRHGLATVIRTAQKKGVNTII